MLLSVKTLKAALLCVADSREVRPYLQHVYVNGKDVVATNGHIGFVDSSDHNPDVDCFVATIPSDILSKFLKDHHVKDGFIHIEKIADKVTLRTDDQVVLLPFTDYYVDYNRAFNPKQNLYAIESIQFNTEYLKILHDVNKLVRYHKSQQPIFKFTGDNRMAIAYWEKRPETSFFIMPCKI